MKGQMFIVIIIFLAGFVFVVQQLLFQYSTIDVTKPLTSDDMFLLQSIRDSLDRTMKTSENCNEAKKNLQELQTFFNKQSITGGFVPDIDYKFECGYWFNYEPDQHALNFSITVTGEDTETKFNGGSYSSDPDCQQLTGGWTEITPNPPRDPPSAPTAIFEYVPESQCRFLDMSDTNFTKAANDTGQNFPDSYTFTIRMKFDQLADSVTFPADPNTWTQHAVFVYNGITMCEVFFGDDGIYLRQGSLPANIIPNTGQYTDTKWHEWSFLFTSIPSSPTTSNVTIYRDGVLAPETVDKACHSGAQSTDGRWGFENRGSSTDTAEMHIGTFKIEDGLIEPTPP